MPGDSMPFNSFEILSTANVLQMPSRFSPASQWLNAIAMIL
jgi:hypothetical protein